MFALKRPLAWLGLDYANCFLRPWSKPPKINHQENSMPRFSIIMPARNQAHTLPQTLDSVRGQTFVDWELILVDDASSDETVELVHSFNDLRIKVVTQEQQGMVSARNRGLAKARGDLIAFLDAADLWMPRKLELADVAFSTGDARLALWHHHYSEFNQSGFFDPPDFKRAIKLQGEVWQELMSRNFIGLLSVVAPRSAIAKAGGFNEALSLMSPWDLWIKLSKIGFVAYETQTLGHHRLSLPMTLEELEIWEMEWMQVMKTHLLREGTPKRKKLGQWHFHREMAHGFAKLGLRARAMQHLAEALRLRPVAPGNLTSLVFLGRKGAKQG